MSGRKIPSRAETSGASRTRRTGEGDLDLLMPQGIRLPGQLALREDDARPLSREGENRASQQIAKRLEREDAVHTQDQLAGRLAERLAAPQRTTPPSTPPASVLSAIEQHAAVQAAPVEPAPLSAEPLAAEHFFPMTSGGKHPTESITASSHPLETLRTEGLGSAEPRSLLTSPADPPARQAQSLSVTSVIEAAQAARAAQAMGGSPFNISIPDESASPAPTLSHDAAHAARPRAAGEPQLSPGLAHGRAELIEEANQCLVSLIQTQHANLPAASPAHRAAIQAETARRRAFDNEFLERLRRSSNDAFLHQGAISEGTLAAVYSELQRRAMVDAGLIGPNQDLPQASAF